MSRPSLAAALLTAALLTAACAVGAGDDGPASAKARDEVGAPSPVLPFLEVEPFAGPLATPTMRVGVEALSDQADAAFLGYLDGVGMVNEDGSWELLLGTDRMADRAAFGALQLGIAFARHHDDSRLLVGPALPDEPLRRVGLTPDATPATIRARLAAVAETAGTEEGTLLRTSDRDAAIRAFHLARRLGLSPRSSIDGGQVIVDLPEPSDRTHVAGWSYVCARRVPGAGAPDCPSPILSSWAEPFDILDPDRWRIATTGPLADVARDEPPTEEGGVSWTNREAQVYRPDQVSVLGGALRLEAEPSAAPSIDTTPFVSGMVISQRRLGWGRVEIDVVVPQGAGLWPALWLLPVAACEAPGRCPGYRTGRYVEVDLLETIGHEPGRLHTSVHWFDERLRSLSEVHDIAVDDGAVHTVWVDWRPGVITHGVGDETLVSFPTALQPGSPLSAAPDHRLVLDLAIGGSFAGEGVIGRNSDWWGDASPPPGWPSMDWERATLVVHEIRHLPLG